MINFGSRLAKIPIVGKAFSLTHRLYVPRRGGDSMPLIVMIHGCAQNASAFERGTRMNEFELTVRYLIPGERPFAVAESDQPSLATKLS